MPKPLAAALLLGVLLSTSGAFDTEAARFGPRLIYWIAIAAVSTLALQGLHHWLRTRFDRVPVPWLRGLGWVLMALPLNTLAALTCKMLFGGTPSLGGFLLLLPGMAAILGALQLALLSFESSAAEPETGARADDAQQDRPTDSLYRYLPLPLQQSSIHALQAEDHYVRVHTPDGEALIRMRLRDAIAMLAPLEGVRPHRSWWVARSAVASLRRDGDRISIQLSNGTQVPVSRSARASLGPLFAHVGPIAA